MFLFDLLAPLHTEVAETRFGHQELTLLPTGWRYTLSSRTNRLKKLICPRDVVPRGDLCYFSVLRGLSFALDSLSARSRPLLDAPIWIIHGCLCLLLSLSNSSIQQPLSTRSLNALLLLPSTLYIAVVMPLINNHCRLTSLISPLASLVSAEASLTISSAAAVRVFNLAATLVRCPSITTSLQYSQAQKQFWQDLIITSSGVIRTLLLCSSLRI